MELGFKGDVVDFYQRYRRGYPPPVIDALTAALRLDAADVVLDLGCGTGQLTFPLAERVRAAIGMDPEPDMLERARDVARERQTANVTWMLGSDTDVPAIGAVLGDGSLGAVTIGQALHWMDPGPLFSNLLPSLHRGGAVAVVTNGRPAWMHDSTWSRALRSFLEQWLDKPLTYACGTDDASHQRYAANLRAAGLTVSEAGHEYVDIIDFEHLIGGVYSALSIDQLPAPQDRADFSERLRAALPSAETYEERVHVKMLIGTKG